MARDCDWSGCAFGADPPVCRHHVVCAVQVSRMGKVVQQNNLLSQAALRSGLPFAFAGEGRLCPSKLRRVIKKIEKNWSQEILTFGRIISSSSSWTCPLVPQPGWKAALPAPACSSCESNSSDTEKMWLHLNQHWLSCDHHQTKCPIHFSRAGGKQEGGS